MALPVFSLLDAFFVPVPAFFVDLVVVVFTFGAEVVLAVVLAFAQPLALNTCDTRQKYTY